MKEKKLRFIPTELNFECWTAREITKIKKQINFLTMVVYGLIGIVFAMMIYIAGLTNSYINHNHDVGFEIQHNQIAELPLIEDMKGNN